MAARMESYGVELEFRNEKVTGVIAPSDPTVSLGLGGLSESATLRVRLDGCIAPPPAIKETIKELATGRLFIITGCIPANPQNPLAAEHLVGAQLPS